VVVGAFDGKVGIDLNIAQMFDEFIDGFAAFAELGRAGQSCRVEDDPPGLRWGEGMLRFGGGELAHMEGAK
jgi:hypothetical protein